MPQSFASVLIHLVFSTKQREPWLRAPIDAELPAYAATVLKSGRMPRIRNQWNGGSRPYLVPTLARKDTRRDRGRSEDQHVEMDQNQRSRVPGITLADRLRSLFRQPIKPRFRRRLYSSPAGASSWPVVSRRVPWSSRKTWCSVRREVPLGLRANANCAPPGLKRLGTRFRLLGFAGSRGVAPG